MILFEFWYIVATCQQHISQSQPHGGHAGRRTRLVYRSRPFILIYPALFREKINHIRAHYFHAFPTPTINKCAELKLKAHSSLPLNPTSSAPVKYTGSTCIKNQETHLSHIHTNHPDIPYTHTYLYIYTSPRIPPLRLLYTQTGR